MLLPTRSLAFVAGSVTSQGVVHDLKSHIRNMIKSRILVSPQYTSFTTPRTLHLILILAANDELLMDREVDNPLCSRRFRLLSLHSVV
jgi:succinylglutamate desuccinylase